MVFLKQVSPFFSDVQAELKIINDRPDEAKDALIARDPVLYHKTMFRAFLGKSKKDTDEMSISEYLDDIILLKEVLKLWHAPFQREDED